MADDRQRAAAVRALLDKGLLAGRKVALYWGAKDADVTKTVVEPALVAAGVTPIVKAGLDDFGTDQAAADQALDTIVAKLRGAAIRNLRPEATEAPATQSCAHRRAAAYPR